MDRHIQSKRRTSTLNSQRKITRDPNEVEAAESTEVEKRKPKPPPIYIREKSSNGLLNKIIVLIGKDNFHIIPLVKGNRKPQPENKPLKKYEVHPIYNLQFLLHRRITVEEPHKRNGTVQCANCQEYGHTRSARSSLGHALQNYDRLPLPQKSSFLQSAY
ncbi:uncharacterized protein LOC132795464 [Drosophila nasuta]|uniref:uncharacterized protein LOC132795464 n=1 Tax=Drosophila nasuta TaxID=42062 RepID=UPI00295F0026|nr:uncharacterized protein LOC132795464 [Drosophila nasuta]